MATYTCISCRVMFADRDDISATELQKAHYKTDWHRYNLKRKVADLPPVTAESFNQRVLAQKEQVAKQDEDTSCSCRTCGKRFNTSNAYENHLKSKKHREAIACEEKNVPADVQKLNAKNKEAAVKNTSEPKSSSHAVDDVPSASDSSSACLAKKTSRPPVGASGSTSVAEEDMDDDDGSDNESEESWSGDALGLEECLFCPHVSASLEKNVKHMTIEHGFFIPDIEYLVDMEGLISYLGQKVGELHMCLWCGEKSRVFTELKSVQQHMVDKGHCKVLHEGDAVLEYADYYDYRKSYPDYKEGDKDEERVKESDDDEEEEEVSNNQLEESGYQLVLPSGATAGHRSLMRYYRQKLRPDRQLVVSRDSSAVSKVIQHYKALGWTGTSGQAALVKAKDIAYVRRLQSHQWTRLGVKANKLQKHYRDQVFGF